MPGIGVAEDEASDLVAYIEATASLPPSRWSRCWPSPRRTASGYLRTTSSDRPLAVAFGFTHCPTFAQPRCWSGRTRWPNSARPRTKLKVLFVSVDSERDTPEATERLYDRVRSAHHGADRQPERDRRRRGRPFDAYYEKVPGSDGGFTFDHTVKTYVVSGEHRLAGSLDLNSEAPSGASCSPLCWRISDTGAAPLSPVIPDVAQRLSGTRSQGSLPPARLPARGLTSICRRQARLTKPTSSLHLGDRSRGCLS
jgi:hypothetical protein